MVRKNNTIVNTPTQDLYSGFKPSPRFQRGHLWLFKGIYPWEDNGTYYGNKVISEDVDKALRLIDVSKASLHTDAQASRLSSETGGFVLLGIPKQRLYSNQ